MLSDSIPGEVSNQNTSLFFLQERLPMLYQVRAARTIARSLRESAIPASCLLLFSVLPRFSVHIHSCLIVHVFSFINAVCLGFIRHFSHCKDVVNAMCRKDPATSKASDVTRREQGRPALYRYHCPRGRTSSTFYGIHGSLTHRRCCMWEHVPMSLLSDVACFLSSRDYMGWSSITDGETVKAWKDVNARIFLNRSLKYLFCLTDVSLSLTGFDLGPSSSSFCFFRLSEDSIFHF